jgi:2-dehydropantoate 2-reductase
VKICIYGAGAIGGLIGARLAAAGETVTLIARGRQLEALRRDGITLKSEGKIIVARPLATDDPAEAGPQDAVILAMKAHSVAAAAPAMAPLLGEGTTIVTAMNGIPYWYFHKHGGPHDGRRLLSLDPDGSLWRLLPPERVLGCVVYPAATVEAPGVVRHEYGNRFMLGEPDGAKSARADAIARAFARAGFKAPVRPRIRDDIWLKLWGNLSFNPVSALTHATLAAIAGDPGTRALIGRLMAEAEAVGKALGVRFQVDIETRIGWAGEVGPHKTSMLQDLELGRPMEIDALVTAVVEMGDLVGIDTPFLDAVLALVVQRAREAGCYPKLAK